MGRQEGAPVAPEERSQDEEWAARRAALVRDLASAINRNSHENGSDTPDLILAQFLSSVLGAFDTAVRQRWAWHGCEPPGVTFDEPDDPEARDYLDAFRTYAESLARHDRNAGGTDLSREMLCAIILADVRRIVALHGRTLKRAG